MTAQVIDAMNAAALWTALEPDGVTPSAEVSMVDDPLVAGYGPDGVSGRIEASPAAVGHSLRRGLAAALDLTVFSELRLSLRAPTGPATPERPFFLRLRFGSVALSLADPGNLWHRLLPVEHPLVFETVKLGLDELPPAIGGAVTEIELGVVDAPFVAHVDDVTAVLPEMLADTDRALEARLAGITVAGAAAVAVVRSAAQAVPAAPALDVMNVDVRFARERVRDGEQPRDFTHGGGLRFVPFGDPYDVWYTITPVAGDRADQASLVEAVVDRLMPFDELVVDGDHLPVDAVWIEGRNRVGGAATADPVLFYKVGARRYGGTPQPVREVSALILEAELLEAAP